MKSPIVFPQPKEMHQREGLLRLGECPGELGVQCGINAPADRIIEALNQGVTEKNLRFVTAPSAETEQALLVFDVLDAAGTAEDYEIDADENKVHVNASSPVGALHGAHTLRQMMRIEGDTLCMPQVSIRDAPDMSYRGIFHETTHASAAMSFDDWKELIDLLSSLKMNVLCIGLYSCWRRTDHTSEYFLFPSNVCPKLSTPQQRYYYSPSREETVDEAFLPRIYEQNFLGDLIAYGRERAVHVFPYLSSLGHNTHIPRMYPEVSMLDKEGNPKGYGFCTSNPKTYELLLGLIDEIVDVCVQHDGPKMFHIGMDEVRDHCECPDCRAAVNTGIDNFVVRHVLRLAEHLKNRGMERVLLWYDMLERGGNLNRQFVDLLAERGLSEIVTPCWWAYTDLRGRPDLSTTSAVRFRTLRPELGLHNWTAPSAGWNYSAPLATNNIERIQSVQSHAELAHRDGAEGMLSYSAHDPIFMEGYYALGEYAWNARATNDWRAFHERYLRRLFGSRWRAGKDALDWMRTSFAPFSEIFKHLCGRKTANLEPGHYMIWKPENCGEWDFEASIRMLDRATQRLRNLAQEAEAHGDIVDMYATDCQYVGAVLQQVLATLQTLQEYHRARVDPGDEALISVFQQALDRHVASRASLLAAMAAVEKYRRPANVPGILRRLTLIYEWTERFENTCRRLIAELRKGECAMLPLLGPTMDNYYMEKIGVTPFDA